MTQIHKFNDPILKQQCDPILSGEDVSWLGELAKACCDKDVNGAGLAAPQIGFAKRAIFIRYGAQHGLTLINPIITAIRRN